MRNFSLVRKIAVGLIIVLIVLTLGFIWGNSLKTKEESSESSESVSNVIQVVVDTVFGEDVVSVEEGVVRKLAHATEFAALGLEFCVLLIVIKQESYKRYLQILPIGLFVAAVDECLQFVSLRGPALIDVLIDCCGFSVMTVVFIAIYAIRIKIKSKKQV
ncbi:MAG: VanZ family protein [Clostridia bacterium]|nr:VanZ family protein [Clostridia bacterium]